MSQDTPQLNVWVACELHELEAYEEASRAYPALAIHDAALLTQEAATARWVLSNPTLYQQLSQELNDTMLRWIAIASVVHEHEGATLTISPKLSIPEQLEELWLWLVDDHSSTYP